jgi:hypothetical protein
MFGLPNPYLLLGGLVGGLALVGGAWLWHTSAVSTAHKAGKAEVMAQWRESDKIALAVGTETTALLKRGAAAQEGKLNAQLIALAARNQRGAAESRSLRDTLAAIAAAPASDPTPAASCRSYEPEYRGCAGLLAAGVELAGEGPRLAGDIAAKLSAMQEYATLVQSVK